MTSNSIEIKVTHCGLCGSDDHLFQRLETMPCGRKYAAMKLLVL